MEINILKSRSFDVVVIGGGPSGTAAAIYAARNGMKTALIESTGCLGGMGTSGLVNSFTPLNSGSLLVVRGFAMEVIEKLRKMPHATCPEQKGYVWIKFEPESLKLLYDQLVCEAGIYLRYFTTAVDAKHQNGVVQSIITYSKSGFEEWNAKLFVDATGDGDISVKANAKYVIGDEESKKVQPSTLCFSISGMGAFASKKTLEALIRKGKKEKKLRNSYDLMANAYVLNKLSVFNYDHVHNPDGSDIDPTSADDLTNGIIDGRQIAHELAEFYEKEFDGAKDPAVVLTASLLGVRESRRIIGDYYMTSDDYIKQVKHTDDIGSHAYQIDRHVSAKSEEDYQNMMKEQLYSTYPGRAFYGIPYRIMLPVGIKNMFVVGRCVSCDRIMQSSIRVTPACMIMGQAAGTATAFVKNNDIRDIDIPKLQRKLICDNVYIGS